MPKINIKNIFNKFCVDIFFPKGLFKLFFSNIGTIIAMFVIFAAISLRFSDFGVIERSRMAVFDSYNRMKPRAANINSPVVIVDIDEKSLAELGQFPWPRTIIAKLVTSLRDQGAIVVGFDAVFAESDKTSPANIAKIIIGARPDTLSDLRSLPDNDQILASAIKTMPIVLGQAGSKTPSIKKPSIAAQQTTFKGVKSLQGANINDLDKYIFAQQSLIANLDILEKAATSRGMFSVEEEIDGIIRRIPIIIKIEGIIKPALATEILRTAFGGNSIFLLINQGGIMDVRLQTPNGAYIIPTDGNGRVWVYYAKPDIFNSPDNKGRMYVSASDIINDRVKGRLAGKIAIIGTSATGLLDIRATPISSRLPGVEIHANLLETILEKSYLEYPVEMRGFEIIIIFATGLLMVVFIPRIGPFWTLAGLITIVTALIAFSWYLFSQKQLLLDVSFPSAATFMVFLTLVFSNYVRDAAEKRQIRSAFGQYLSPDLVEQLAESPEKLTLGGETKTMSLLFCDVRGFTTISESFNDDPQGLTQLLNRLLTPLSNEILQRNGTIDKYMGDCIMAFWNAPFDDELQELHALEAAHGIFSSLDKLNALRKTEAEISGEVFLPLKVGIGINTGQCVVGNMGSEQRFDYSVIGDAVNLAARLEGQSKNYGVDIVLGHNTAIKVKSSHAILELDLIAVKGKSEAVHIYTSIGNFDKINAQKFDEYSMIHAKMIKCYRSQKWDQALGLIEKLTGRFDAVMDQYLAIKTARIMDYKKSPPDVNWDGQYIATTK